MGKMAATPRAAQATRDASTPKTPSEKKTSRKGDSKSKVRSSKTEDALPPPLQQVGGYMVVPVKTPLAGDQGAHMLYVRRHQTKLSEGAEDTHALFVTNLPPLCSAAALELLFGDVRQVTFGVLGDAAREAETATPLRPPASPAARALLPELADPAAQHRRSDGAALRIRGSFALVTMGSAEALAAVLAWRQAERHLLDSDADMTDDAAVNRLLEEYESVRLDAADLQARADAFMSSHDMRLEQERMSAQSQAGQPDEDGFVTVTRHGPRGRATERGVAVASGKVIAKLQKEAKPKAAAPDFYRFQLRQAKREQLAELRRKFEEDKLKVERMKAQRRFRPY